MLVLVVYVASQANLAEIVGRSSEAVLPADLASPELVARIVLLGHCRLGHESFAHPAKPLSSDEHESPKAKSAGLSLLGRLVGRWFLVFCFLEARGLAHVGMIVDVAKPTVGGEISGESAGINCELFLCSHRAIRFAKAYHLAISIIYVERPCINPASLTVGRVL